MLMQREIDAIDLGWGDTLDYGTQMGKKLLKEVRRLRKALEKVADGEHGSSMIDNPWGYVDALLGPRGTVSSCRRHDPSCTEGVMTYYEGNLTNGREWYADSRRSEGGGTLSTVICCGSVRVRVRRFVTTEQEVLNLLYEHGWELSKAMEKRRKAT